MNELDFLLELRRFIELTEETIDEERGQGRNLEQMIYDGDAPDIYDDVLRRIKNYAQYTAKVR